MSVKTLESYQEFTADGSTTYFTFNFNYVDSSEIVVGMRTGDNQYTVVDPVNYVLTKSASTDGGKIRFVTTKPCENPDDPTCGDYIDNPPPAGTIVRIERKTVRSSTADWYVGLDMNSLVGLFDKLIRITQENTDKFKNTIQTFPTQQGITVRELLSEHDKKIFCWNNEKQWIDITDFTIDDVVRQTDVGNILKQANAYSDEQNAVLESRINGKLTAVDAQIDANADAIQKTREDFINADSEIHQILNSHANELTTLRGNQASLGDQVSGIEEKIPGDASATNQLATKADLANVDLDGYVKKSGDTMTGDLAFEDYSAAHPQKHVLHGDSSFSIKYYYNNEQYPRQTWNFAGASFFASTTTGVKPFLGHPTHPWDNVYAKQLNNGADISVPTLGGTLARIEDLIDLRADINEADSELQTQITAQAAEIATKQDQLVAGDNIVISGNTISATGAGGGAGLDMVVVDQLPETGQKGILYLVKKDGAAPDIHDEYVWIESTQTFELIGTTQVDLTDYAKKEELDNYLPLTGGEMTGAITFSDTEYSVSHNTSFNGLTIFTSSSRGFVFTNSGYSSIHPTSTGTAELGRSSNCWRRIYVTKLNNGADIAIPATGGTLARLEDITDINNNSIITKDLTVSTDEGTLNIGITAGVATIATNNGLDIVAQTKFDTAPTTDDNTTYANALDTSLVRKAQVATAIADAMANVDALPDQTGNAEKVLTTDGTNASWTEMPGLIIRRL